MSPVCDVRHIVVILLGQHMWRRQHYEERSMWKFDIVGIEKTSPPVEQGSGHWYRYTIANHITEITGTRRGSREEVARFVQASVERLNNRHHCGPAFRRSVVPAQSTIQ